MRRQRQQRCNDDGEEVDEQEAHRTASLPPRVLIGIGLFEEADVHPLGAALAALHVAAHHFAERDTGHSDRKVDGDLSAESGDPAESVFDLDNRLGQPPEPADSRLLMHDTSESKEPRGVKERRVPFVPARLDVLQRKMRDDEGDERQGRGDDRKEESDERTVESRGEGVRGAVGQERRPGGTSGEEGEEREEEAEKARDGLAVRLQAL